MSGSWTVQPRLAYGRVAGMSAVQSGNYAVAKERLLAYYRSRSGCCS
ncbi:hypothetical protein [Nonomuraea turkmeniaca]|nr:hypothetical protein [Nonomuraea turkmeniaca]